jgi:dienelactone hydrolase
MALMPGREAAHETRLDGLPDEPLQGLVGAFLIYPYCGIGCVARDRGLRVGVPTQAFVGTNDMVVGGRPLARTLERMKTPLGPMKVEILQSATHAFDELEAADIRVKFDPVMKAKVQGMYADFLRDVAQHPSQIGPHPTTRVETARAPGR